ncbi:hypothetical protein GA0070562_1660 [Micromonospora tulbaghiae]|uniref:Uncharacterized protein n=1 Tax=Micromonospora tulbaghiae TaxID=479978 RepID=A0ABY0KG59_9ACTN|nr:hypothetical protein GA0070562_1660 [Micromonospora tulbaghiae]
MTVLGTLLVVASCLSCIPLLAPSAPCDGDTYASAQAARDAYALLVLAMTATAVLSVVVARAGTRSRVRNPWPWLAVAVLGIAVSAGLMVTIDRAGSC